MSVPTHVNLIAGLVMFGFGLLAIFVLIPFGIDEPGEVEFAALSPSYFPRIICMMLAAFGAMVTGRAVLQLRARDGANAEGTPDDRTPLRTALVFVLMFGLYFALEPVGFPLASILVLLLLMAFGGERRVAIMLPVSVGVPALLYLFFTEAASIPIPAGILEPILVGG